MISSFVGTACRGKRVAYEVLMGLHYLHGFKVVMLDLKSPNVLLAADGTAKLADVGLARLMSVTSLSHKIPTGTWAWAAPEALLGNKVTSCCVRVGLDVPGKCCCCVLPSSAL